MTERKDYPQIDERLREQAFIRKHEMPAAWAYLCNRHREFWNLHGRPDRKPPQSYRDKDQDAVGWFFPKKWVEDFTNFPPTAGPGVAALHRAKPLPSVDERTAHVERVLKRYSKQEQISAKEAEHWQLPIESQVTPQEVIYPDGRRESIDAMRIRFGAYQPGMAVHAPEQENLEAMLRMKRPWYDQPMTVDDAAPISSELKRVLNRKWHIMGGEAPTMKHGDPESGD
jgi:hypothetical protein